MTKREQDVATLDGDFSLRIDIPANGGLTETAETNRRLLAAAYEDMLAGNAGALFDLLDPEVRFHEAASLPYAADATGIEATIAGVQRMIGSWRSMSARITEYVAGGDLVIAYIEVRAEGANGVFEGPVAELFRFRDGRIVEWRPIYWDTHAVRTALGAN